MSTASEPLNTVSNIYLGKKILFAIPSLWNIGLLKIPILWFFFELILQDIERSLDIETRERSFTPAKPSEDRVRKILEEQAASAYSDDVPSGELRDARKEEATLSPAAKAK